MTCVRHHIFALSRQAPTRIAALLSARHSFGGSAAEHRCEYDGTCVDGFHYSRRFEASIEGGAKARMARLFARARFCLIPEGDSPESSRLFDAVNAPLMFGTTKTENNNE